MSSTEDVVLVTGASTGIGRACALRLDQAGLRVVAGVRRAADGQALRAASSDRLRPVILDVTDAAAIAAAADLVRGELGGARLAGIVNNAGIGVGGPLEFVPLDHLRRQFEVNVVGVVAVIQAFLPMLREGRGRIVTMGSIGGRVGQPFAAPYTASKHALEAMSDALRLELKPWHIEVCLIEPGNIATPIWEKGMRTADALARSAPQRVFQLYGRALEVMSELLARQEASGIPPDRVADAVLHALTSRRPKTRYLVGSDARVLALLRTVLPDRWRDELILRYTKLPRDEAAVAARKTPATRATTNGRATTRAPKRRAKAAR